jgi:hypothetical protein
MSPLYYKIQEVWSEGRREQQALNPPDPLAETPKIQEARELEQLLADRFESVIESYNEGLLSASELFTQLYVKAYAPIQEGE